MNFFLLFVKRLEVSKLCILKLSSSGKQYQIVLTQDLPAGTVLAMGASAINIVNSGNIPFARLSILPFSVSPGKFPISDVFGSDLQVQEYKEKIAAFGLSRNNDAYSPKFNKERKQSKSYTQNTKVKF